MYLKKYSNNKRLYVHFYADPCLGLCVYWCCSLILMGQPVFMYMRGGIGLQNLNISLLYINIILKGFINILPYKYLINWHVNSYCRFYIHYAKSKHYRSSSPHPPPPPPNLTRSPSLEVITAFSLSIERASWESLAT